MAQDKRHSGVGKKFLFMFVVKVVTIFQSYRLTFYFSFSLEGMGGQNNNFGNKRVYSDIFPVHSLSDQSLNTGIHMGTTLHEDKTDILLSFVS